MEISCSVAANDVTSAMMSRVGQPGQKVCEMGELSAARQVLEGVAVAPGDEGAWCCKTPPNNPRFSVTRFLPMS